MQEYSGLAVRFDPAQLSQHSLGVLRAICDHYGVDSAVRAPRLFKWLRRILDEENLVRTLDGDSRRFARANPVISDVRDWQPNDAAMALASLASLLSADSLSPEPRAVIAALNVAIVAYVAAILRMTTRRAPEITDAAHTEVLR